MPSQNFYWKNFRPPPPTHPPIPGAIWKRRSPPKRPCNPPLFDNLRSSTPASSPPPFRRFQSSRGWKIIVIPLCTLQAVKLIQASVSLFVNRDHKDGRYVREKMSLRHAKELFESSGKMERELKHLFNGKYSVRRISFLSWNNFWKAARCGCFDSACNSRLGSLWAWIKKTRISFQYCIFIFLRVVHVSYFLCVDFLGTVHGSNLSNVCSQIQEMVDEQQKKTVWVPLSSV